MATARAQTSRRRAAMEARLAKSKPKPVPLSRQVAYRICTTFYTECVCAKAIDKPICDRIEGASRHIIDLVRNESLK